jgi:hypothetical protein
MKKAIVIFSTYANIIIKLFKNINKLLIKAAITFKEFVIIIEDYGNLYSNLGIDIKFGITKKFYYLLLLFLLINFIKILFIETTTAIWCKFLYIPLLFLIK